MPHKAIRFDVNYPYPPGLLPYPERLDLHPTASGRGVTIALVDSGFAPHADIRQRIKRYVDASSQHILEYRDVNRVDDWSWHGQMTSFIAAGDGQTSGGRYRGIAPEADMVLVRATSERNTLHEADIWRGMDWLSHRCHQLGIKVLNASIGGDYPNSDPGHILHQVVRRLTREGVTVVLAAGNSGMNEILPPASAPEAIVVGGYDDQNTSMRDEWFVYHNNYGVAHDGSLKPDIIAPAVWLPSPILAGSSMERDARWLAPLLYVDDVNGGMQAIVETGFAEMGFPGKADQLPAYRIQRLLQERIYHHKLVDQQHQHVDGTSVAAPIVSGVVAQMLEVNPGLQPHEIKRILTETAVPLPGVPSEQQGAGMIQPKAAVMAAMGLRV